MYSGTDNVLRNQEPKKIKCKDKADSQSYKKTSSDKTRGKLSQ
jgi:hypothetical protein